MTWAPTLLPMTVVGSWCRNTTCPGVRGVQAPLVTILSVDLEDVTGPADGSPKALLVDEVFLVGVAFTCLDLARPPAAHTSSAALNCSVVNGWLMSTPWLSMIS